MRKYAVVENALREITELRKLPFQTKVERDLLNAASRAIKQWQDVRRLTAGARTEKRAAAVLDAQKGAL